METKITEEQRLVNIRQKKDALDNYETPDIAVKELLKYETFQGTGWEPACGNGAISKFFPDIYSSDIRIDNTVIGDTGIDFLMTLKNVDYIITNPPYSKAIEFAKHSIECANKVALLLRLQFLESKERYLFFKDYPPRTVYVFSKRITCNKKNKIICFAWYIWEKNFKGDTIIKWIFPEDEV